MVATWRLTSSSASFFLSFFLLSILFHFLTDSLKRVFGAQTDANDADLKRLVDNVYGMDGVEDVLGDGAGSAALYAQPIAQLQVCVLTHPGASEMLRVEYEPAKGSKAKMQQTAHGPFVRRRWVVPKATQEMTSSDFDEAAANAAAAAKEAAQAKADLVANGGSGSGALGSGGLREVANMGCEVPFSRPGDGERVKASVAAVENNPEMGATLEVDDEDDEELRAVKESLGLAKGVVKGLSADGTMPAMIKAELAFIGDTPFNTAVATAMDEPVHFPAGDEPQKMWVQLGALKDKIAIQVQLVRPSAGAAFRVDQCYISTPAPDADAV